MPAGATISSVDGLEFLDEMTWVDEGCKLWTPQRVECLRMDSLEPGDTEEWTFHVQLDADAPSGELGVAALKYDAYAEDYELETVLTVTGSGDDDSGAAAGGDGEELPDTGTSSTTVTLVALGLVLAGGAAMTLRSRRA